MKRLSCLKLSEIIKKQCSQLNLTIEQLSEQTGIGSDRIVKLEQQKWIPSLSQLEKLGTVLTFDIESVFADDNSKTMFTSARSLNMTEEEKEGVEHLMDMMLAAKQQILLRKALYQADA